MKVAEPGKAHAVGTQENCLDGTVLLSTKSSVWVIITKAKVGSIHHQGSNKKFWMRRFF